MSYKKYREFNSDIHVYTQESDEYPRLLQSDELYQLSMLYSTEGTVAAIINCSYFTDKYVLGRNQGDLKNDTHDQPGFYDLVLLTDETYKLGQFKSWDCTENVRAGFSVAAVLVQDGQDVELLSTAIVNRIKITKVDPQTAVAVLKDGTVIQIVVDGRTSSNRGCSGLELRKFVRKQFPDVELLVLCDGGGSSEMRVNGETVNKPSDGKERKIWNGLAFIKKPQALKCPFKKMAITQFDGGTVSHKGSDAWDISTGTAGVRAPYFAPCDLVCVDVDKSTAFTWWESKNKVKFADGSIDYMTVMFGHDNTINAYKGMEIKQGIQVGNMGDGGNAAGVHCHIEVAKGKYQGKWFKNKYGVYCLFNTIKFYDAFFMDGTELVGYSKPDDERWSLLKEATKKFKYLNEPEKPEENPEIDELKKQVAALTSELSEAKEQVTKLKSLLSDNEKELATAQSKLTEIKEIVG